MKILCHPLKNQQLVYIEIPKAGCTTIKAALANLRGPFYHYRESRDHQFHARFGYTRLPDIAALWSKFETIWANFFKFTVIRNPFTRFESLFYDKIVASCECTINKYVNQRFQKSHWMRNVHGVPQTRLIGTELGRYDFIGRLENFSETVRTLEPYQVFFPATKLNPRPAIQQEPLSPITLDVLREIYCEDFRVLGYSLEYPTLEDY